MGRVGSTEAKAPSQAPEVEVSAPVLLLVLVESISRGEMSQKEPGLPMAAVNSTDESQKEGSPALGALWSPHPSRRWDSECRERDTPWTLTSPHRGFSWLPAGIWMRGHPSEAPGNSC